jgi:peptidoglycan pentaglycine glycine transferase (the first glycine)
MVTYNLYMNLVEVTDQATWDNFVRTSRNGHPLQLWGWGEAKRLNNWQPLRLLSEDGTVGAQMLLWSIPKTGRTLAYIPRGPICEPQANAYLLGELVKWAQRRRALYLRIEPSWTGATLPAGWQESSDHIQLPETYSIDLAKSEDEILSSMDRKHRQYINKSEREGVKVRRGTAKDLGRVLEIYRDTARRAGFGIHGGAYYEELWEALGEANYLYLAETSGKVESFLWISAGGPVAYELYGGVSSIGQSARANYILKWTAIRELKAAGYQLYDFNGRLNDGVSKFKDGFGPAPTDWIGTWDYPLNRLGYTAWTKIWPLAKPLGRRLMSVLKPRR